MDSTKPVLGTAEELANQTLKILFLAVYLSRTVPSNSNDMMVKVKAAEGSTFKVFPSNYSFYQVNTSLLRQLSYAERCRLII